MKAQRRSAPAARRNAASQPPSAAAAARGRASPSTAEVDAARNPGARACGAPAAPSDDAAADLPGAPAGPQAHAFYRDALACLTSAGVPFLLGGAYALAHYTGIARDTKDLDVFVRRADCARVLGYLAAAGYRTEVTFSHWLAKAHADEHYNDIIVSAGNGVAAVDDLGFTHAVTSEVLGSPVRVIPAEEMIWSKAFIMERDRYDGADIAHLLRARGRSLDWSRLVARFGEHWRVLLSHLVLFGFVYPTERRQVPPEILAELVARLASEPADAAPAEQLCRGTLLSLREYLPDVERWGFRDARLLPHGSMTSEEVARWTAAFVQKGE
jgi:hypothetical protein